MSNIVLSQATKLASVFGMDSDAQELVTTLKATAFKGPVSDSQMAALLIVANQYGLNPWCKEIYAFPDKQNGIIPVVGVDGWSRIINTHAQMDGMDFEQDAESCTCIIYRKDRTHPIKVTEWMDECKREPRNGFSGPWQSHPKRMLRHKAMIQCARLAFGFVGIFEQDEAERITEAEGNQPRAAKNPQAAATQNAPDGLEAFESEHLQSMRDASLNGLDALQSAFVSLPKSSVKSAFWGKYRDELHKAATAAAVIDSETGEVIE